MSEETATKVDEVSEGPATSVVDRRREEEARRRLPREHEDEFSAEQRVYEPHRVGLPPLGAYFRELWRRRQFAFELARTNLRAQHFNTALGQLWLVLNPLLLGLRLLPARRRSCAAAAGAPNFFAHLCPASSHSTSSAARINQGAKSVVGGGRLILNTAFPRTLLPLSSVLTSFMRFLPCRLRLRDRARRSPDCPSPRRCSG